ncbi:hypothetical protein DPX16_6336 [Anabarilius grahami]|uniref:Uncharacterized protein n=1 Tax=Anabarilius grahami TaxID=495550 RepID=A0A3N0YW38_ANAGA|nr:hypothetical protein DPX16_6336 [Anabarilius grahami]
MFGYPENKREARRCLTFTWISEGLKAPSAPQLWLLFKHESPKDAEATADYQVIAKRCPSGTGHPTEDSINACVLVRCVCRVSAK